jgi:hypothetical protein
MPIRRALSVDSQYVIVDPRTAARPFILSYEQYNFLCRYRIKFGRFCPARSQWTSPLPERFLGALATRAMSVPGFLDGFSYVFGGSKLLFRPSHDQSPGFPRNELSFRGAVIRVSQMNVWWEANHLRGRLVVPRNVEEIVRGREFVRDDDLLFFRPVPRCDRLIAVAFESQPCVRRFESQAFCVCRALRSICIPASVRAIVASCFWRCETLMVASLEGAGWGSSAVTRSLIAVSYAFSY